MKVVLLADYYLHTSDITFDFTKGNEMIVHQRHIEPWKVTVVDTGLNTMTGGRIKRIQPYVGDETFLMTYGDGVCDPQVSGGMGKWVQDRHWHQNQQPGKQADVCPAVCVL